MVDDVHRPSATATGAAHAFHEELDRENERLWSVIFDLPFIREIATGGLDEARFRYFVEEDILYLDAFSRALTRAAGWAEDAATRQFLLQRATGILREEVGPHTERARIMRIDVARLQEREPGPVTVAYIDHMLRVVEAGPLGDAIAAVLPCYWVYRRVGERLAAKPPDHPLYRDWILTYDSKEFAEATDRQIALLDRLAAASTEAGRQRMRRWFRRSLRYEWMFWDQAYSGLSWPVR